MSRRLKKESNKHQDLQDEGTRNRGPGENAHSLWIERNREEGSDSQNRKRVLLVLGQERRLVLEARRGRRARDLATSADPLLAGCCGSGLKRLRNGGDHLMIQSLSIGSIDIRFFFFPLHLFIDSEDTLGE